MTKKNKNLNLLRNIIDLRATSGNPSELVSDMLDYLTMEEQEQVVDVCVNITAFYIAAKVIDKDKYQKVIDMWGKIIDDHQKAKEETVH